MEENRVLAIDYGKKRVGIAITDPLKIIAYPLTTILNDKNFWKELKSIFEEFKIEKVILGYPLRENGDRTDATDLVEKFHKELKNKFKIDAEYFDERFSSYIAKQKIIESVPSKKKRRDKSLVDKNAAAVILEDYLREQ